MRQQVTNLVQIAVGIVKGDCMEEELRVSAPAFETIAS
jgi:hypothetical protein